MGDKPRVLVITPDFPPAIGGIQTLVHRVVRNSNRLTIRVITLPHPGATHFDSGEPTDVRRSPEVGRNRQLSVAALNAFTVQQAFRYKPAVVLSAHIVAAPGAWMVARTTRSRTIQYLHADELRGRPRLARFAVTQADAVVAVSTYTRLLALRAGADPARVRCILNGVDSEGVSSGGALFDTPTIVTVAGLTSSYKGHDVVMRALPLVLGRVRGARWLVVGKGPLLGALEAEATRLGVRAHVDFLGEVSDDQRDEILDRAHVFVMPSRLPVAGGGEGFGIVYLEAGARGLPVVAGNVGGALDSVIDGKTGILVDPVDHVAVADAIADLLLDSDRARQLGEAGRRRAAELPWSKVAHEVEDLVLALVSARR